MRTNGAPRLSRTSSRRALLLLVLTVSGGASLAYEVIWSRALSVVFGSTTHAVSLMLATFMLGLAIGGLLGGRIADRTSQHLAWLGAFELGVGLLGLASYPLIGALPAIYLAAYRAFHLEAGVFLVVQAGMCASVMLGPAALMGATFPVATRALAGDGEPVGSTVGRAYGFNTAGAVLGSLAAGFVLVPALGLRGATFAAAGANLAVGLLLLFLAGGRAARGLAVLALCYLPAGAMLARAERGYREWGLANLYRASRIDPGEAWADVEARDQAQLVRVYESDGADGYVAAYRTRDGHLVLQVGGKMEGTELLDEANARLLALLPFAAHAGPRSALVVGLGAGTTLETMRRVVPGVHAVEINRGVIEAVRRFGPPGVLDGVTVHVGDARNYLLTADRRFDLISSEPSYPTDLAVANLFSREYFELVADRLTEGGVFAQWLPYYVLTNDDVTMMIKTFASVFPDAMLFKVERSMDLILVGSRRPLAHAPGEVLRRAAELGDGYSIPVVLSRGPAEIAEIAARPGVPLNTDARPLLEFDVERNFRVGNLATLE